MVEPRLALRTRFPTEAQSSPAVTPALNSCLRNELVGGDALHRFYCGDAHPILPFMLRVRIGTVGHVLLHRLIRPPPCIGNRARCKDGSAPRSRRACLCRRPAQGPCPVPAHLATQVL